MKARHDPSQRLLAAARRQGWLLTTDQARAGGLGRRPVERLIGSGRWVRLTEGIYYVRADEPPWNAYAWAGVLLGGVGARLGGEAAGHLHEFVSDPPELIQVLVPGDSRKRSRGRWRFSRDQEGIRLRPVGSPPRTYITDAVLDLSSGLDEAGLIELLTRAIQTRRVTAEMIADRLGERSRVANRRLLVEVLGDVAEGAQSPLEIRYLRDVERAHALPRGQRQHERPRMTAGGRSAGRGPDVRDVVYVEFATIAELDGRLGHAGAARFRDMDRDNRAAVVGEQTLRFGWHDVCAEPCRVARMVAAVLRQRGWTGVASTCRRCRLATGR